MMRSFWDKSSRGVTIVELLVAMTITIGMMLATSMVFKASTDAAGLAKANDEVMTQYRALTSQLEQDFAGFRPDMPWAVIFENHTHTTAIAGDPGDARPLLGDPDEPLDPTSRQNVRKVRYDRIFFFTNGNFTAQDLSGAQINSNMACVFYGQMEDDFPGKTDEADPPRKILARRWKMLTPNTGTWFLPLPGYNHNALPTRYDYIPVLGWLDNSSGTPVIRGTTVSEWKNFSYAAYYATNKCFNGALGFLSSNPAQNANNPYPFISLVMRPNWNQVSLPVTPTASVNQPTSIINEIEQGNLNPAAAQKLYFLGDVTDFRIDLLIDNFNDNPMQQTELHGWFPNTSNARYLSQNVIAANSSIIASLIPSNTIPPHHDLELNNPFGIFWNVPGSPQYFGADLDDNIRWWSDAALVNHINLAANDTNFTPRRAGTINDFWPRAIRFTFTLYDGGRRHFPEGKTFSYIVNLPPRN